MYVRSQPNAEKQRVCSTRLTTTDRGASHLQSLVSGKARGELLEVRLTALSSIAFPALPSTMGRLRVGHFAMRRSQLREIRPERQSLDVYQAIKVGTQH